MFVEAVSGELERASAASAQSPAWEPVWPLDGDVIPLFTLLPHVAAYVLGFCFFVAQQVINSVSHQIQVRFAPFFQVEIQRDMSFFISWSVFGE